MSDMQTELQKLIEEADNILDSELGRKHAHGSREYGEWAFLQNPTLDMAMDEIVDYINYMRYTYRKLYIMNQILKKQQQERQMVQEGFIPTSQLFGQE